MLHLDGFLTEIRTFYSLKEIREFVEVELNQYRLLYEDYSQWLGSLLRNPESAKNQDWTKKTAELQRVLKTGGRKGTKKEEKKTGISTEWVQFKDVLLCAENLGEAEMLFEATEELRNKIDKLEKAKNSLIDLERYGLGKDLLFVTYIHDGIPEKIVFKPKKDSEVTEKFEFVADFSIAKEAS
ncbi:hypothetical protein HXY32_04590 [Candidatus Bathyarchaeota archaeon]|nr:hypothetical protein [Candidatus Bathyarchaeota archaeon]